MQDAAAVILYGGFSSPHIDGLSMGDAIETIAGIPVELAGRF